jgi:hypothetical protein
LKSGHWIPECWLRKCFEENDNGYQHFKFFDLIQHEDQDQNPEQKEDASQDN